jgi:glutamine synthetase
MTELRLPEGINHVDALIPDINGVLRGKRLGIDEFPRLRDYGLQLPGTVFTTDITGATVGFEDLGWLIGDPDLLCRHSPATLCPVPWDAGVAQVLLSMHTLEGEPFFADPRHVLERVLQRYRELDLRPVLAMELEFYLTEYDGGRLKPHPPKSPLTGEREWGVQVYGMTEVWDFRDFLGDIERFCQVQGVPAAAASSEYAPGQFEVNLHHTDDVILACEHVLMLKHIIRHAAVKHGMCATFMPKPYAERAGNGCHIHVSVLDSSGQNIFADPDESGSEALKHAVGGLLDSMTECTALFAPGANAYRRLVKGAFAPVQRSWDVNNRTVALRIPAGDAESRRVEHRVAGADVNPWLLTAAVLAGMLDGMTRKLQPPARVVGNAYKQDLPGIPETWKEALETFSASAFVADYLGEDFRTLFARVKEHERRLFEREITPLEYQWYLRRI